MARADARPARDARDGHPAWCRVATGAGLATALVLACAAPVAAGSDFFGPSEGMQLQPELDVVQDLTGDRGFRLIGKILPTVVPSQSYAEAGVGLYAAWLVSPIVAHTISPDLTRRRRLDLRLGVEWYPSIHAGTAGDSKILQVEAEGTPRLVVIPGDLRVTFRNRVEARWQLEQETSFAWRLRFRPQVEREFALSGTASLTPFGNAELIWSTARDMWDQFRLQIGLQLGVAWFGKGQIIELNGSTCTHLQPSHSYTPAIGAVWYQYF